MCVSWELLTANTLAHGRLRGAFQSWGKIYFLAAFCLLMRAYGRQPLMLSMSPMWACKSQCSAAQVGPAEMLCLEDEMHLCGGRHTKQMSESQGKLLSHELATA